MGGKEVGTFLTLAALGIVVGLMAYTVTVPLRRRIEYMRIECPYDIETYAFDSQEHVLRQRMRSMVEE
jgi:hypothetical protein